MKKIGILGSGIVAQTLGAGLIKHGYSVMLGTRQPEKLATWQQQNGAHAAVGTVTDAAVFGQLIMLAVKGAVAASVVEAAGLQHLNGKTVIDTSNPIADAAPEDGVLKFFTNLNESLLERLQAQFPAIHFVKAFNSVGAMHMVSPGFKERPTMFICGNNDHAKEEVHALLQQIGWDSADMGKAAAARAIEPLCMLWCIPGLSQNEWNHAFRLLKA